MKIKHRLGHVGFRSVLGGHVRGVAVRVSFLESEYPRRDLLHKLGGAELAEGKVSVRYDIGMMTTHLKMGRTLVCKNRLRTMLLHGVCKNSASLCRCVR